jgi:hypothetical protein
MLAYHTLDNGRKHRATEPFRMPPVLRPQRLPEELRQGPRLELELFST